VHFWLKTQFIHHFVIKKAIFDKIVQKYFWQSYWLFKEMIFRSEIFFCYSIQGCLSVLLWLGFDFFW